MLRIARLLISMILLLVISGITATSVFACSPGEEKPSLQEKLKTTDLVFVGTVIGTGDFNPDPETAIVQVESYLKGSGAGIVAITGFGSGSGDCKNSVPGGRTLFYADGNGTTGETLNASYEWGYIGSYDAAESASPENIAAVTAIVRQKPSSPESLALMTLLRYLPAMPIFAGLLIIVVPVIMIGAFVFFGLRLRRRNTGKFKRE